MPQRAHELLRLAIAGLAALSPAPAAHADALVHELGTRHRFVQPSGFPYPAVGCNDHRSLMFVVRAITGEDKGAAELLLARDCRPLVSDAEYIRCGPGGFAHPLSGEPLSYAAYCRVGANDLALYALDLQMPATK